MTYQEFLETKRVKIVDSGFGINESELNKNLFNFQRFIVKKALKKGRYAIFADTGMGKTIMQLEWAFQVATKTKKPVLILAPLAVSGQTIKEGSKFGIEVNKLKSDSPKKGIWITNYEQLKNIDRSVFGGIVLDESSILKSFNGKMRSLIIDGFEQTEFKLACTATPSPNDPMELGNHSEFLNIMKYNEMLAMFFFHDGGQTSKWKLKGHAEKDFYQWLNTWGVMFSLPSDIGFKDDGFVLPTLHTIENQIITPKTDNGKLFNDGHVNATDYNKTLRLTKILRIEKVIKIIEKYPNENIIIWIKQNEEADYLKSKLSGYDFREVRGNDSPEKKEADLLDFASSKFKILITKLKIAQFGMNFQNCHVQIFASLDFSFESTYQGIRRSWRFGQKSEVFIHLITTDTMINVFDTINRKQSDFQHLQKEMTNQINQINKTKKMNENEVIENESYTIKRGDSCELIKQIPDKSIGFSIFSPPFASLYTYSDSVEDMGNNKTHDDFYTNFGYLVNDLNRIMQDGRLVAVHCADLPILKGKEGYIGFRDFTGEIIRLFESHNFIFHSRITIWKDPVIEMQRTKALGLLHKQLKKDSSMSRAGNPDYLVVFRKHGENLNPIENKDIPVELWQKYASPVWMDINQSDTLQFRTAKDNKDEKHICPLQLGVIERAIQLWSNEGDIVFTPFGGIFSEVYQAIKMKRIGYGIELKQSYFDVGKNNCYNAVTEMNQLTLF